MTRVPAEFKRYQLLYATSLLLKKEQPVVSAVLDNFFCMQVEPDDMSTLSPEAQTFLTTLQANLPELTDTSVEETKQYADQLFDELNLYIQVGEIKPDIPKRLCMCEQIYSIFDDDESAKKVQLCRTLSSQVKGQMALIRQQAAGKPAPPAAQQKPTAPPAAAKPAPSGPPVFTPNNAPPPSQPKPTGPPVFTPNASSAGGPPVFTPNASSAGGPPVFTPNTSNAGGPPVFTPNNAPPPSQPKPSGPPVFTPNTSNAGGPPVFTPNNAPPPSQPKPSGPPVFTPNTSNAGGPPVFTPNNAPPPSQPKPSGPPVFTPNTSNAGGPPVFTPNTSNAGGPPVFTPNNTPPPSQPKPAGPPVFTPSPSDTAPVFTPNAQPDQPSNIPSIDELPLDQSIPKIEPLPTDDSSLSSSAKGKFDLSTGLSVLDAKGLHLLIDVPEVHNELCRITIKNYLKIALDKLQKGDTLQSLGLLEDALFTWAKGKPQ
ncbi:hypothetical protein GPJ56_004486 [Histomonas meleagridis]|uniref:uncharacterized protein n=1 Tax=Histomonas meleagridis TaxID=135588 RepID=UPI00355A4BA5|nr:hypothetical protein GPJ56_004486 [Histomonas meleagridis]KAH0801986.1 hypothetical protein GO595_005067 [Histomonas meleagridis]